MNVAWIGGRPGIGELLIILAVLLLLFGGRKIPEIARALGKSLGEFKKGRSEGGTDKESDPSVTDKNDTPDGKA